MKLHQVSAPEIPELFLRKMAGLLKDEYDQFQLCLQQPANNGLRVNSLKITSQSFLKLSPFNLIPVSWCQNGFVIKADLPEQGIIAVGKHPYHHAGLYYLQEPSAMAAGAIIDPQPGEKILDLAAAPGGKATHLAALMQNSGFLVANEIHPRRVWDLAENLERCGVTNAIITNETPQRLADYFGEYFDRVILDAPCSGEGMFRKSLPARKEWKLELVRSCAIRQATILEQAARMVKPGGYLAYTTCTFSPEENEGVIARFLSSQSTFELKAINSRQGLNSARPEWINLPPDHELKQAVRIWPHQTAGEGHFIAFLYKTESMGKSHSVHLHRHLGDSRKKNSLRKPDNYRKLLGEFADSSLNHSFERQSIVAFGSYIYQLPDDSPDMRGLKVIHPGWWLGSLRKDQFLPSHALAMGIHSDEAKQSITFSPGDVHVAAYLCGENFTNSGDNGWILVSVDGFPLGWGKRVQNIVKNYYPRGLRRYT